MPRIYWCGHSYFIIEAEGATIAVDPHDGDSINLPTCRIQASLVLVSHNHFDHNAIEVASGPETRIVKWKTGSFKFNNITIEGREYPHDKSKGGIRGKTVAYKIRVDGVTIVHAGDLGSVPQGEDLEWLRADVLMIPVGGVYTIDASEAWKIVEDIKPKIAIPMHYWIPGSILPLDPLERFLNIIRIPRERLDYLDITGGRLPPRPIVAVLTPRWKVGKDT